MDPNTNDTPEMVCAAMPRRHQPSRWCLAGAAVVLIAFVVWLVVVWLVGAL